MTSTPEPDETESRSAETGLSPEREAELKAAEHVYHRKRRMMGGALITVLALGAVIYALAPRSGNLGDGVCTGDPARSAAIKQLATGEMAALLVPERPETLPELTFTDASGEELTLERFRGKTVLLNLWATWCAPCREEMPALDRLQGTLGGDRFEVVAVNVDTRNPAEGARLHGGDRRHRPGVLRRQLDEDLPRP